MIATSRYVTSSVEVGLNYAKSEFVFDFIVAFP